MASHFHNDDENYLTWLDHHPSAFVLNISVSQKPRAMLHASKCFYLRLTNPKLSHTTGEKVGSERRGELEQLAESTGLQVTTCSRCKL